MIWECFELLWKYLKGTAWFWQLIATVGIPLYFIYRDRRLKKDQVRYISDVISDFVTSNCKCNSFVFIDIFCIKAFL